MSKFYNLTLENSSSKSDEDIIYECIEATVSLTTATELVCEGFADKSKNVIKAICDKFRDVYNFLKKLISSLISSVKKLLKLSSDDENQPENSDDTTKNSSNNSEETVFDASTIKRSKNIFEGKTRITFIKNEVFASIVQSFDNASAVIIEDCSKAKSQASSIKSAEDLINVSKSILDSSRVFIGENRFKVSRDEKLEDFFSTVCENEEIYYEVLQDLSGNIDLDPSKNHIYETYDISKKEDCKRIESVLKDYQNSLDKLRDITERTDKLSFDIVKITERLEKAMTYSDIMKASPDGTYNTYNIYDRLCIMCCDFSREASIFIRKAAQYLKYVSSHIKK